MINNFSKQYNFLSILKFVLPNIATQIFLQVYSIVDGAFVSTFVGDIAIGALNIVYPIMCIELGLGIMIAVGGNAIVAYKMGEGKPDEARQNMSMFALISFIIGVMVCIVGIIFIHPIVNALGASSLQYDMCIDYGKITLYFAPTLLLQVFFQTFFVTAGKPMLGLISTVLGGIGNVILDYIFIVIMNLGVWGAGIATGIGQAFPMIIGLGYFTFVRKGNLYFVKPKAEFKVVMKAFSNGSSEMVTNLALAITTFLFNQIFMHFYGEFGVSSISIVLYFQYLFSAIFVGYSIGVAPIISYKYGAKDNNQLKSIIKWSIIFTISMSVLMYLLSVISIKQVLKIFTDPYTEVYHITIDGFKYFAISFIFMGVSIFASSMFTAFGNGVVSAVISFSRTFIFLVGAVIIMSIIFGNMGAWLSVAVAEFLGLILSIIFLCVYKKKYHY